MYFKSCECTAFSTSFDRIGKTKIGRWFSACFWSPDLKTGTISACFQTVGTVLVCNERFTMWCNGSTMNSQWVFPGGNSSVPVAFFRLNF